MARVYDCSYNSVIHPRTRCLPTYTKTTSQVVPKLVHLSPSTRKQAVLGSGAGIWQLPPLIPLAWPDTVYRSMQQSFHQQPRQLGSNLKCSFWKKHCQVPTYPRSPALRHFAWGSRHNTTDTTLLLQDTTLGFPSPLAKGPLHRAKLPADTGAYISSAAQSSPRRIRTCWTGRNYDWSIPEQTKRTSKKKKKRETASNSLPWLPVQSTGLRNFRKIVFFPGYSGAFRSNLRISLPYGILSLPQKRLMPFSHKTSPRYFSANSYS